MSRREWGEFLVDDAPARDSKNLIDSGTVYAALETVDTKIQRGLNTRQSSSLAYSFIGALNVTDSDKRGMMAFEIFCCKECATPIRMTATFGYQADNNLSASYSKEASVSSEYARYKLAWRFADDHTANSPKIEIWLIDTIDTGAFTRRCGCVVHMINGIEWTDGSRTTDTLPSGLTDFTPFHSLGQTVNVNKSDSNTDTSSFVFVNGHVYHLTASLLGAGFSINTPNSGMGTVVAYIGSTTHDYHYISRQNVGIQQGLLTTDDIRLPVDWKAENIAGSSDNKLHIKVIFNNVAYNLVQSNYVLQLIGTDFSGA